MFFKSDNISFEILTVQKISRKNVDCSSYARTYNVLAFRIKGGAEFYAENEKLEILENDILFVPSTPQYSQKTKGEEIYAVHFVSESPLPDVMQKFSPHNPKYFNLQFSELYSVWTAKKPGYHYRCKSLLYKIIGAIESEYTQGAHFPGDKIADAVDYIHNHFTEGSLSVDALAKICAMSDTYFRRLFVKRFSMTPLKYINRLKLSYAKELLQSGYYTIEEVSEKCGFLNINYFSLFFKKETGKPPSRFTESKGKVH